MIWLAVILLSCVIGAVVYTNYKPITNVQKKQVQGDHSLVFIKGPHGWGDHLQGMFHLWVYCKRNQIDFKIQQNQLWHLFDSDYYTTPSPEQIEQSLLIADQKSQDVDLKKQLTSGVEHAIRCNSTLCEWSNEEEYLKDWKKFWSTILIPNDTLLDMISPIVSECRSAAHFRFGDIELDIEDGCKFIHNTEKVKESFINLKMPKPTYIASDNAKFISDLKEYKSWNDFFPETSISHTIETSNQDNINRVIVESMIFYYLPTVAICEWSNFSKVPALSIDDHKVYILNDNCDYNQVNNRLQFINK